MATNFPTSLDSLTNPSSGDVVTSPDHAGQHANANDAIEALQAKVGINSSAVTTSHDYKLSGVTSTDKAVSRAGSETLTNKTIDADNNTISNLVIGAEVTGASTALSDTTALTYNADTDVSSNGWVVDEDDMSSDLATKVPTQQSVKAYVDSLKRVLVIAIVESDTAVTTGNGTIGIPITPELNGYNIVNVQANVYTKGVTGTTDIQIRRQRGATDVDVLSTKITIGDEYYASDEVINTSNDDLATGDMLFVDVDAIHSGTAPNGLSVAIVVQLP